MEVKRGDVFLVNFGATFGSVQGGMRPAVIVQNDVGNAHSPTVTVVPITSAMKKKHMPTHVMLNRGEGGVMYDSMILAEQICTINKTQLDRKLGAIRSGLQKQVALAVRVQLDI